MGEIADSLIDGEFDYVSGEYIGKPCGYPRTHYGNGRKKSKTFYGELTEETRVVWNYMHQNGIKDNFGGELSRITKEYGTLLTPELLKTSPICKKIRENKESWETFKQWFTESYKKQLEASKH